MIVRDELGEEIITLEKVIQYRYLGIDTYSSMYKTGSEKQKHAIKMARRYKGACLTMSRRGPDAVLLARTLWVNVAIPAIFFGTESVIFLDTTINKLNSIQSQVFKAILSLPISTHNMVTQTECGVPHISY